MKTVRSPQFNQGAPNKLSSQFYVQIFSYYGCLSLMQILQRAKIVFLFQDSYGANGEGFSNNISSYDVDHLTADRF